MPGPDLSALSSAIANWMQKTEDWLGGVAGQISDTSFRAWARSEAAVAASVFIPAYQRVTSVSFLTAPMLRMYLRGTTADPDVIRQVADEIELSATFRRLADVVREAVDREVGRRNRLLTQPELDAVARGVVNAGYRDPTTLAAMYFLNSDRGLQGVIGGINDLRVGWVTVTGAGYTIQVVIVDRYDFDNNQNVVDATSDLGKYVEFRTRLDGYIRAKKYREFLYDYHKSLYFANPIARARTFAAFMYAIERNGLTSGGVSWQATVPLRGTMRPPAN
jgi:hypothetical protein